MNTTRRVIDPAGAVRGSVQAGASFAEFLGIAWGLGSRDRLVVVASDTHRWALSIYRPGPHAMVDPTFTPLEVRTGYVPGADPEKTRAAMLEAAWLDLVDEGWSVA